jgi:hypothetical protein
MMTFYSYRHETEEGRRTTLKFLELEEECDTHNITMLQSMDLKGISKTNINKATGSFDIKKKSRLALKKKIATEALSSLGRDRTWILEPLSKV